MLITKTYSDCKETWQQGTYNNGLILTPDIDKLFDRKYLSFNPNTGEAIFKNINSNTINKLGLQNKLTLSKIFLTEDRKKFLKMRNEIYGF